MTAPATIKLLQGLPMAMGERGERHLLKALETFCFIKSIYVDRPMPAKCAEAVQYIAQASLRSAKTIQRRIALLVEEKWLRPQPDGLHPISWETLREQYAIRHYRFYHLKPCKTVQLEYLIKAKIFHEKKQHCKIGYKAHLQREKLRAEMIEQVSGSLSSEAVAEHQLHCFVSAGQMYDEEARYALSLQYTRRDQEHLHGDLEINYKTTTRIFGYQSNGGAAYMKRTLQRKGVIEVTSRRIDLGRGKHTTLRARKTRLGFVLWNEDERKLQLVMPDKVEVIPNNAIDAYAKLQRSWGKELQQRLQGGVAAA